MNSINDVKSIIKKFEAGILDADISSFENSLSQIRQHYKNTPSVVTLLKMMGALGKHLGAEKENAHPDSMEIMNSLAAQLEKLLSTPYLDSEEVDKIISDQISRYRVFQNQVVSGIQVSKDDMENLKAVILEIDWEITVDTLRHFEAVVRDLLFKTKNNKIYHIFLKIIYATARQISIEKANAPSDSISFLRTVFEHFQTSIQDADMSVSEKKQLIEEDIHRFKDFRNAILEQKEPEDTGGDITGDMTAADGTDFDEADSFESDDFDTDDFEPDDFEADDFETDDFETDDFETDEFEADEEDQDVMPPALSHIKATDSDSGDDMTLTELHEDTPVEAVPISQLADDEEASPAPAEKQAEADTPQKDIMGDLFSMKESPADELLDAIHLMEVHGEKGKDQAMKMLDSSEGSQSGVKNFTPGKKDTAPIPEIGSRLDEFFSLDSPSEKSEISQEPAELDIEFVSEEEELTAESADEPIVPFDSEDETFEDPAISVEDELLETGDSAATLIKQLKFSLETQKWFEDTDELDSVLNEINALKDFYSDDSQKIDLLDMISLAVSVPAGSLKKEDVPVSEPLEEKSADEDEKSIDTENFSEEEILPENQSGIWAKIKSMFSS